MGPETALRTESNAYFTEEPATVVAVVVTFLIRYLFLFSVKIKGSYMGSSSKEHYKDLSSKPFFPKLISYITSGPAVCMECGSWG
ncbi:hypothetical protein L1987_40726 [Smallanthus sonchifolius]|uniref:Uncharacterized protein n=1 Tax=Smallanthus sonchifolius TaxID=185202 RepID=A0ACB9GUK7_9ASTR|nr:hypothetical protein L1987_40726 [Smallanthus sonchifolius]